MSYMVYNSHKGNILAHKDGSVAILKDNGTDFKNKVIKQGM